MEVVINWFGFIGAWLLFAGSIYQAVLELQDEDIEFDRIRTAGSKLKALPSVSAWWWLLPPVKFYKELQRGKKQQVEILKLLAPEDVRAMVSFNAKAFAWLLVASGGVCFAFKETYELSESYQWSGYILGGVVFVMIILSIINVVYRLRRARSFKAASHNESPSR